jgi:sulfur dioxygenase
MIFRQLYNSDTSTFTYLVGTNEQRQCVLIDPTSRHLDRDLRYLAGLGLDLLFVLLTSTDPDRLEAATALRARTGARIASRLGRTGHADVMVQGGDVIEVGSQLIHVLDTPGDTDDAVSYLIGRRVFTGNALSVRTCGRLADRCRDPHELYDSVVEVLFALPEDTIVCPSFHTGGTTMTTIGEERRFNPELADRDRDSFVSRLRSRRPRREPPLGALPPHAALSPVARGPGRRMHDLRAAP